MASCDRNPHKKKDLERHYPLIAVVLACTSLTRILGETEVEPWVFRNKPDND